MQVQVQIATETFSLIAEVTSGKNIIPECVFRYPIGSLRTVSFIPFNRDWSTVSNSAKSGD